MKVAVFIKVTLAILIASYYTSCNAQLSVKRSFDKQTKELTVTLHNQYDKKISIIQPYIEEFITCFYIFIINDEFRRDSKAINTEIYPNFSNQPIILRFNQEEYIYIESGGTYSVKFSLNNIPEENRKGLKEIGSFGKVLYFILDKEDKAIKIEKIKIEKEYFDYD